MHTLRSALIAVALGAISAGAGAAPFAYVANSGDDSVAVVDLASWSVLATIPAGHQPINVAIHPNRPRVYVVNAAGGSAGSGSVSVIDTHFNTIIETLAKGLGGPWTIAVDATGAKVYVSNDVDRTLATIDTVARTHAVLYSGRTAIRGIAFDPTGNTIYFSRTVFNIMEAGATDGSGSQNLSNQQESGATGVVRDADFVYWADGGSGLIRRHDFSTNFGATTLASNEAGASWIAVDTNALYWTRNSGSLMTLPTGGDTVVPIVSDLDAPAGLAIDANYAYVPEAGANALTRIPLAGGAAERLPVGTAPTSSAGFIGDNTGTPEDVAVSLRSYPPAPDGTTPVQLTADIAADLPAGGSVQFCDGGPANDAHFCEGGTPLCEGAIPVTDGHAVCTTDALGLGLHHLTAQYGAADMSSTTPVTLDLDVSDRIFADGFDTGAR